MTDPTGPPRPPRAAAGDASSRVGGRSVVVLLALILGVILVAAAVIAILVAIPTPPPDCEPGTDCGGPPPAAEVSSMPTTGPAAPTATTAPPAAAAAGIRAGTPWRSSDLAYEFEYSDWWNVDSSDGSGADLFFQGNGDAELIVSAVPASQATAEAYADDWFGKLQGFAPDLKLDTRPRNEILGPEIGFVDGIARTYAGSRTSAQGGTSPIAANVVTASDGRTTVAVILVVWDPDGATHGTWQQHFVRGRAEILLKTFRWGPVP